MTDRRSDRPASRTIRAGESRVVHGVRIDVVSVDGDRDSVRLRVWRETELEREDVKSGCDSNCGGGCLRDDNDNPAESATATPTRGVGHSS